MWATVWQCYSTESNGEWERRGLLCLPPLHLVKKWCSAMCIQHLHLQGIPGGWHLSPPAATGLPQANKGRPASKPPPPQVMVLE